MVEWVEVDYCLKPLGHESYRVDYGRGVHPNGKEYSPNVTDIAEEYEKCRKHERETEAEQKNINHRNWEE